MPPSHPAASRYRRPALLLGRPPIPGGSFQPDPGAYDGPRRPLMHSGGAGQWAWPVRLGEWWAGCCAAGVITNPFLAVRGRCAQLLPFSSEAVAATSKLLHLPALGPVGRVASILLVIAMSTADQANPRRISRRSCRHPENRRPCPGVLAAQGHWQARLMSATHRR